MESRDVSGVDRISSLPESLVIYILSFLPIKFVVPTIIILSKSWKFRWTQLTSFYFEDKFWERGRDFVEFINMVLHHAESISRFSLEWHNSHFESAYLHTWVDTVIARNVQVFNLSICHGRRLVFFMEAAFFLTSSLYISATLEVLRLQGPIFIQLPNRFCLPKLTSLELESVIFGSDDSIDKLVSSCPGLQSLKITRCHYHDSLLVCCISSPSLKRLEIRFYCGCDYALPEQIGICELKVKIYAPALETLVLYDNMVSEFVIHGVLTSVNEVELDLKNGESIIVDLAEALNLVKSLTLSKRSMNAICEAPGRLRTSFARLTKLVVEFDTKQWSCLVDLIGRCINLEVLDIRKVGRLREWIKEIQDRRKVQWDWQKPTWTGSSVPRCFLSSLKQVSFRGLVGDDEEMDMLGYILGHCLLIEKVFLWYGNESPPVSEEQVMNMALWEGWFPPFPISEEERKDIVHKVSMLYKASPTCEVSHSGWWDGAEDRTIVTVVQFCQMRPRSTAQAG